MSELIMSGGSPEHILAAGEPVREYFDLQVDPDKQPDLFLDAIQQLDPRYKGDRPLVRYELEEDQTEWSETAKVRIMQSAEGMRLLATDTPLIGRFAIANVLGAARMANVDRWSYAVDAVKAGKAQVGWIYATGSARKLKDDEKVATASYAPNAKEEFDLIEAAQRKVVGKDASLKTRALYVPNEKAGNQEVMVAALHHAFVHNRLQNDDRVAAVTTQIYQPATSFDLARVANRFGITDTLVAGNPSNPKIVANRTPATYLSEVLRTMRAAVQFWQEIPR